MKTNQLLFTFVLCLGLATTAWGQSAYYWADGQKITVAPNYRSLIVQMQPGVSPSQYFATKNHPEWQKVEIHERKGRAVLHFRTEQSPSVASVQAKFGLASPMVKGGHFGIRLSDGFEIWPTEHVVLEMQSGLGLAQIEPILANYGATFVRMDYNTAIVKVEDLHLALPLANALQESNLVKWSHPDFYAPISHNNDPLYPQQFQMNNTGQTLDGFPGTNDADCNAPEAWAITTGSSSITVVVMDDGVEAHEDLVNDSGASRVLGGYTPLNGGTGTPLADGAHGQACAGIIAASHNTIGVRGLAPQVNLRSVNIFAGGETTQDLANAFTWSKNIGADVISNSWGYTSCTFTATNLTNAIADARTNGRGGKGCVIVFASGNGYKTCVDYPANLSTVIAVGAFGNDGIVSDYSNEGTALDIAAPSNDISPQGFLSGAGVRTIDRMGSPGYSTGNYTNTFGGTSAACPVVSGVAALVLSVNANLTVSEVENILYTTAIDMGASGRDNTYGHGRVNAFGAVQAANGGGGGGGGTTCTNNEVSLTLVLDNYPAETSWSLRNSAGTTVASGGGYTTAGATITETFCLVDGCYDFVINDSYGDGICCAFGNGSYALTSGGNTLASGGSFGSTETKNFCLGSGGGGTGPTTLLAHFFETGFDGWLDGGGDCARYSGSFSYEGSFSIQLRDNSGTASAMTSPVYNVSAYDQIDIEFYFYANGMEIGEDFWVRYYNGSAWQTVATYARGTSFNNGTFYRATVSLSRSSYNFPSNAQFRFQCDASDNTDQIYIDAVTITATDLSPSGLSGQTLTAVSAPVSTFAGAAQEPEIEGLSVYPNPVKDWLQVRAGESIQSVRVFSSRGALLLSSEANTDKLEMNLNQLPRGLYVLEVKTAGDTYRHKFIKE
ncbi:MAG: hypothetical protein OHK0053_31370 [Microscillaceae bacterium]